MRAQDRGGRDTGNQPEDAVQHVEDERQHRVDAEAFLDRGRDQVDEREHAEDGDEEVKVDHVAAARFGDHVAGDGEDEEGPEELKRQWCY